MSHSIEKVDLLPLKEYYRSLPHLKKGEFMSYLCDNLGGIDSSTVRRWFNGRVTPSSRRATKALEAFENYRSLQ